MLLPDMTKPWHVKAGGDHAALVQAADELHNDLACAVVVNDP